MARFWHNYYQTNGETKIFNIMKKNSLNPKKPFLFSVFPIALIAAFGALTATTSTPPEINPDGVIIDTLPGDTTGDPATTDTAGFPTEEPAEGVAPDDAEAVDTAGSGGVFDDPVPADTNGFNK